MRQTERLSATTSRLEILPAAVSEHRAASNGFRPELPTAELPLRFGISDSGSGMGDEGFSVFFDREFQSLKRPEIIHQRLEAMQLIAAVYVTYACIGVPVYQVVVHCS